MIISGFTSNKLDLVSGYDSDRPYIVGLNGVTNITYNNLNEIQSVSYTIDEINYVTNFDRDKTTKFYTNYSGENFEPQVVGNNLQNTFDIKEESKMKLVFPTKVTNDLFIERMEISVFERHSRLSNIKGVDQLEDYKNGYYKIVLK
jgi:hypothetical protein